MILDDIAKFRREQLEREKAAVSFDDVKKAAEKLSEPCRGFGKALADKANISVIAEVKKASPSKGIISEKFDPVGQAEIYEKAGASAVSCLTEEHYFMGSSAYLTQIHEKIKLPVLRKDFIIDPYQIYEARVIGADAVLLIAAMLDRQTLTEYRKIADSLGLDVLGEAHNERELDDIFGSGCRIAGVNNRDLTTFEVSLKTTERLSKYFSKEHIMVSESGIKTNEDIKFLRSLGADAVLIGETLMRGENAADTLRELLK